MSTRPLHGRSSRPAQRADRHDEDARRVPPFHRLFPMPNGFGPSHVYYEVHRAANRAYRHRLDEYRRLSRSLSATDLAAMIREDVLSNVLAIEKAAFGPFKVPRYVFLNAKHLQAWRPAHRQAAEALLHKFSVYYRRVGTLL